MRSPVSLEYTIVVALLAVSAAVLSYMTLNPVFNVAALLLGIYALHLVSVRVVVRQYAGVAPATRAKRATGIDLEAMRIREELDLERRELDLVRPVEHLLRYRFRGNDRRRRQFPGAAYRRRVHLQ